MPQSIRAIKRATWGPLGDGECRRMSGEFAAADRRKWRTANVVIIVAFIGAIVVAIPASAGCVESGG